MGPGRPPDVRLGACLLAGLLLHATGCGNGRPPLVAITGVVTLDGAPVAAATVTLMPRAGGRPATGATDQQGRFTLTTFAPGDGAVVGEYDVVVTKMGVTKPAAGRTSPGADDGLAPDTMGAMPSEQDYRSLLPRRYADPRTSGLTVALRTGGPPLEISLTSGPGPSGRN
jgi:hypothetical protein